jgi:hypothetical protein
MVVATTISCYSFPRDLPRDKGAVKLAFLMLLATVVWAHGCSGFVGKTAAAGRTMDPDYPTVDAMLPAHANVQNP